MLTDEYRWIFSSLLSPFVVFASLFSHFLIQSCTLLANYSAEILLNFSDFSRWNPEKGYEHRHFVSIFLTDPFIKPKFYLHKLVVGQIIRLQFKLGSQQLIFKENIKQTLKIYCSYLSYLCCTFVLLFVRPSWPSPKNHLKKKSLWSVFQQNK